MRTAAGARLGPYEILQPLGAGGMGEVYRAHDHRLQRDVALKIILGGLDDAAYLPRFQREARLLATLNHPNVANLYEFDEVDGTTFIVMELVPGQTLAERLAAGPIPVAEAIRIATQIAAALEAVHEKGIIHRDLKPSNIKLTADGVVKVLDFGLAKAAMPTAAGSSQLATATLDATRSGTITGTAAYMSPEQARGWDVDRRSDIWSFGCVLFEMLAGRPTFAGATMADTLAAVIERELDWRLLPAATPPAVVRVLRRCLQRDLTRRLRDIGDARLELEDALDERSEPSPPARASRRTVVAGAGLLIAGLLLGALAVRGRGDTARLAAPAARFAIGLPATAPLGGLDFPSLAIAPDGSRIVYVASRGSQTQLFLREMDALEPVAIAGTTNALAPFFSPDGKWIAFFADGELKKVPVSGGTPVTVTTAQVGLGGSWSVDGEIVFAAATGGGLFRVPAGGGAPERATTLDIAAGEFSHRWPEWLPGGKAVLYTVGTSGSWDEAAIVAHVLGTDQRVTLVQGGTHPRYLDGHLVYAQKGRILRVQFDAERRQIAGTPEVVLENVLQSADGASQLAVSPSGTVVYATGAGTSSERRLMMVARDGAATPLALSPGTYVSPRVSPDGGRLLVSTESPSPDLWLHDIASGAAMQLTFDAMATAPTWSPTGSHVAFSSTRNGAAALFTAPAGQPGAAWDRIAPSANMQMPGSWGADGTLAYVERRSGSGRDILVVTPAGDRRPRVFAASPAEETAPRLSPDGRWVAYVSNVSGGSEVYVQRLDGGPARRVSRNGGSEPMWARAGGELFYREGDWLMTTRIGPTGTATAPQRLFEGEFARGTMDAANYDAMPDGQRFVMIRRPPEASATATLHIAINWLTAP